MKRGWLIAAGYESAGLNGCADCGQNNQARRTGFGCRMSRAVVPDCGWPVDRIFTIPSREPSDAAGVLSRPSGAINPSQGLPGPGLSFLGLSGLSTSNRRRCLSCSAANLLRWAAFKAAQVRPAGSA